MNNHMRECWYYYEKSEPSERGFTSVGYGYKWGLVEAREKMQNAMKSDPESRFSLVRVTFERWPEGEGVGCLEHAVLPSKKTQDEEPPYGYPSNMAH